MAGYLEKNAIDRQEARNRLLGTRALPINAPPAQALGVEAPPENSNGLMAILQALQESMAPKGIRQTEAPALQVAPSMGTHGGGGGGGGGYEGGDGGGGAGGLGDLLKNLGGQKPAAVQQQPHGARLSDMVRRGGAQQPGPYATGPAATRWAQEQIPGLKPGIDASKAPPGTPAAQAYLEQQKPGGGVVGVEKGVRTEGYQSDLDYLNQHGGHATIMKDGAKVNVPLGTKGNYGDINPELAARLRAGGELYEKETGKAPTFGESSRGDDVQKTYWEDSAHGTKYAAARPQSEGGRGSEHLRGNAMDLPGDFQQWMHKNGDRVGVHFPVANDAPHAQVNPAFNQTLAKPGGPAVPAWDKGLPAQPDPKTAWGDPSKPTPITGAQPVDTATGAAPAAGPGSDANLSPQLMKSIMQMESSGNPNAVTGQYKGLYQLSDKQFADHGGQGSIFDPAENTRVAKLVIAEEAKNLSAKLGRPLTQNEIYMAHQQGYAGAAEHIQHPERPAWESMYATPEGQERGPDWAKRAVWGNLPAAVQAKYGSVEKITSGDFLKERGAISARNGVPQEATPATAAPANAPPPAATEADKGSPEAMLRDAAAPGQAGTVTTTGSVTKPDATDTTRPLADTTTAPPALGAAATTQAAVPYAGRGGLESDVGYAGTAPTMPTTAGPGGEALNKIQPNAPAPVASAPAAAAAVVPPRPPVVAAAAAPPPPPPRAAPPPPVKVASAAPPTPPLTPAAVAQKHSGLELARANIDTPIEQIAMERFGQKGVDEVSWLARGKTPRQLAESYGGMFLNKAEPLFKGLGITRQDFEAAAKLPPAKQDIKMRFVDGLKPPASGARPTGNLSPFSGFRPEPGSIEDRRNTQGEGQRMMGRRLGMSPTNQGESWPPAGETSPDSPLAKAAGAQDIGKPIGAEDAVSSFLRRTFGPAAGAIEGIKRPGYSADDPNSMPGSGGIRGLMDPQQAQAPQAPTISPEMAKVLETIFNKPADQGPPLAPQPDAQPVMPATDPGGANPLPLAPPGLVSAPAAGPSIQGTAPMQMVEASQGSPTAMAGLMPIPPSQGFSTPSANMPGGAGVSAGLSPISPEYQSWETPTYGASFSMPMDL